MISINIIGDGAEKMLAACDKEHLGKTFSVEKLRIEVTKDFYGGEIVELEKFAEILKNAPLANLVGEKTVGKAVELGLVSKDSVIKIQDIPHVQLLKI